MDPGAEELASFDTIKAVLAWATVPECVAKSLFRSLGNPSRFRDVALMPKSTFDEAVALLRIYLPPLGNGGTGTPGEDEVHFDNHDEADSPPQFRKVLPVEVAQLEAFRRACVRKCGGDPDSTSPLSPSNHADSPQNALVKGHSPTSHMALVRNDSASSDLGRPPLVLEPGELIMDHWPSVARASRDAHTGAQALAKAAEEVRLAAERSVQDHRLAQARHAYDEQKVAEQWRLLAEERERLNTERTELDDRTQAVQAAEQRNEERAALLQRLRRKGQMTQRCARCGTDFIVSENGIKACKYHNGRWVPNHTSSPKSGPSALAPGMRRVPSSSSVLQNAGGAVLSENAGVARNVAPAVSYHWSCCGSKDQYSPGCNIGAHVAANLGVRSGHQNQDASRR